MNSVPREGESLSTHPTARKRPDYKIDPDTGCWEWQKTRNRHGYGTGSFRTVGIETQYAHRAYYIAANGQVPKGLSEGVVDHLCRNPCCVNPAHLEYVPARTNVHRGRLPSLTAAQVEQIRERLADVEPLGKIARDFDVHENTIWHIAAGWSWSEGGWKKGEPIRPIAHCLECGDLITTGHRDKKYCCKEHRMRYVGRRTWRRKHWGSPDATERPA